MKAERLLVSAVAIAGLTAIGCTDEEDIEARQEAPSNTLACSDHAVLAAYSEFRQSEVQEFDNLPPSAREDVEVAYRDVLTSLQKARATFSRDTAPFIFNGDAYGKMLDGDKRGALDLLHNLMVPIAETEGATEALDDMEAYYSDVLRALQGEGSLAEIEDRMFRLRASRVLESVGCPADLNEDYGLAPYQAP